MTGVEGAIFEARVGYRAVPHFVLLASYDLWNITDIVEAAGAGVTSVSLTVLPLGLRTKVFSRPTFPSASL